MVGITHTLKIIVNSFVKEIVKIAKTPLVNDRKAEAYGQSLALYLSVLLCVSVQIFTFAILLSLVLRY